MASISTVRCVTQTGFATRSSTSRPRHESTSAPATARASYRNHRRTAAEVRCRATTEENNNNNNSTTGVVEDDKESREVLDAFFIGKALAETLLAWTSTRTLTPHTARAAAAAAAAFTLVDTVSKAPLPTSVSTERAGGVFADTLGEIAKFDAERREEIREFQDDVMVGVVVVQAELI